MVDLVVRLNVVTGVYEQMAPIRADQDVAGGAPEPGDGRPAARIFGRILVQVGIGGEHKICVHLGLFHPLVEFGKPVGERLLGI